MQPPRDVVITGVGIVSPIGIGNDAVWSALLAGRSGVERLQWLQDCGHPVQFGGAVKDFEPKEYVRPRKALKVMSWELQLGFAAAVLAQQDAGIDPEQLDHDRTGVVYGADMFYCPPQELVSVYRKCSEGGTFDFTKWGQVAMKELYPLWMLLYLPNMVACHIGISADARGPNNTITVGEASSLLSVQEAATVIERGLADVMIAGGVGNRLNVTPMMYRGELQLSHRNDDPAAACRPFEANRDGLVNGEGAAAVILESRDHARRRGARIRGELAAMANLFGTPDPGTRGPAASTIERSIREVLETAELSPDEIGFVKANAMGTDQDAIEAKAIRSVLGDVPVTAPKSFVGNLGGGAGAVELAVALLGLEHRNVPMTLNFESPDPECPVKVVHRSAQPLKHDNFIALQQSTTGQAAAMLVTAPQTLTHPGNR